MNDPTRAESRLDNIRAVEPILSALRTVSQGSMQSARKRGAAVERYGRELLALTAWLPQDVKPSQAAAHSAEPRTLVVALGSDRGLCGRFNIDVADRLKAERIALEETGVSSEVWSLGMRLNARLSRMGIEPAASTRFARRALPAFSTADDLAQRILRKRHSGEMREVVLLLNRERRAGHYHTVREQLLPAEETLGVSDMADEEPWPPPIIETDPAGLLDRILAQATAIRLFGAMLASSAAEHAARYHLLEDASQNTERLTEELELAVQLARQQAITTEMQELAAGSGLMRK